LSGGAVVAFVALYVLISPEKARSKQATIIATMYDIASLPSATDCGEIIGKPSPFYFLCVEVSIPNGRLLVNSRGCGGVAKRTDYKKSSTEKGNSRMIFRIVFLLSSRYTIIVRGEYKPIVGRYIPC